MCKSYFLILPQEAQYGSCPQMSPFERKSSFGDRIIIFSFIWLSVSDFCKGGQAWEEKANYQRLKRARVTTVRETHTYSPIYRVIMSLPSVHGNTGKLYLRSTSKPSYDLTTCFLVSLIHSPVIIEHLACMQQALFHTPERPQLIKQIKSLLLGAFTEVGETGNKMVNTCSI